MSQKPSACFALIRTITNGKAAPLSTTTTTTAADSRFAFWWYSSFDLHTFFYYLICLIDCHFLSVLFRRVSRRFAFYIHIYIFCNYFAGRKWLLYFCFVLFCLCFWTNCALYLQLRSANNFWLSRQFDFTLINPSSCTHIYLLFFIGR